jgi:hypothetical protein
MLDIADWFIFTSMIISTELIVAEIRFCRAMGMTSAIRERRKVLLKDTDELSEFSIVRAFLIVNNIIIEQNTC